MMFILRPAQPPLTNTLVSLTLEEPRTLLARLPDYHDVFRATMHRQGFTWDRDSYRWGRVLPAAIIAGAPLDRLAEVACALVDAGFIVRLPDAESHARAVARQFQPEQRRWIRVRTSGRYSGWLVLLWPYGSDEDYYRAASNIRGARYRSGQMIVPAGSADEIEDFARTYGFALSEKARAVLDEVRESLAHGAILTAPVSRPRKNPPTLSHVPPSAVPPVLAAADIVEIADELRDDD